MSKQGNTKEKILRLISEGKNNLTQISDNLELAPSTVSKHLKDLEDSGKIERESNSHVKKWKYYRLNTGNAGNAEMNFVSANQNINRRFFTAAIAIAIMALAISSYLRISNPASVSVPISITDPPQVPAGTQALYINYSSLSVRASQGGGSEWIPVNASGRLDLMSLINETQVLGEAKVPANSTIDAMRLNVTSASITIDNVSYTVQLTKRQITASVEDSGKTTSSSSLLVDFSPVVTPMYGQNSTTFVMLPSVRALSISGPKEGKRIIGGMDKGMSQGPAISPLKQQYREALETSSSNLSIVDMTLYSNDSGTFFGVKLDNSGKSNATVMGVALYGNITPRSTSNATVPRDPDPFFCNGMGRVMDLHSVGMGFVVEKNSTLALPSPTQAMGKAGVRAPGGKADFGVQSGDFGYVLDAHSSAQLQYSGKYLLEKPPIRAEILNGSTYKVLVITNKGILQSNVTAK